MTGRDRLRTLQATVQWYLDQYYGTPCDNGGPSMYCDQTRLGFFAVAPKEFSAGRSRALFRVLVASTVFQRRQDQQVFRILKGLDRRQVADLTDERLLLRGAQRCRCPQLHSSAALHLRCDLRKDPGTKQGTCATTRALRCPPKAHTVLLKRYADFGKVPSSGALVIEEDGGGGLAGLHRRVMSGSRNPTDRALDLERRITTVWRVSEKIGAMFLSAVSNPDLGGPPAPWNSGLDWTRWVVIDSNVDLFLTALGFPSDRSYPARRDLVRDLSSKVPLRRMRSALQDYNPRIVQQAMYAFMGRVNRRANPGDCMHVGPAACRRCPRALVRICPAASR